MQNYKQSCANITYDASTDVLLANCSNSAIVEDSTSYGYTMLPGACQCSTNLANVEGNLQCVPESELVSSAPASDTCPPLLVLYTSNLDKSGSAAPDGVSCCQPGLFSVRASISSTALPAVPAVCACVLFTLPAQKRNYT